MPRQYKLQKIAPFVRPAPNMPEPLELALTWLNAQAAEGWVRPDLTLTVEGESVTLGPTFLFRDEPHMLLVNEGEAYEYALEAPAPFMRPVPQMPDPAELAMAWVNGKAEQGWELPAFTLGFNATPETVTLEFEDTIDVGGAAKLLLRRPKPNA